MTTEQQSQLLGPKQVCELTGIGRTKLYELCKRGLFPQPRKSTAD